MSNVSMSLVGMLYNIQLLEYAGENGVAAYGTMMYVNMIFLAAVLLLPLIWGIDGIWRSIAGAELMAVIVGVAFLVGKQKKYQY